MYLNTYLTILSENQKSGTWSGLELSRSFACGLG